MIPTVPFVLAAAVCFGPESSTTRTHPASLFAPHAAVDSTYRSLWESGQTFADFVADADSRKEQWEANFAKQAVPDALVSRLTAAVTAGWKLFVVTRSGCSDSVNSIPYLGSLVARVPTLEMRLIDVNPGMKVLEAHRTPDGRPATPTVILLDADFNERGCWIERPAALISWMADQKGKISDGALFEGKMKWYDEDRGASSLEEIVQMVEAAAGGKLRCGNSDSGT
ncbi:MAG TPA: thioredoxin family protein [Gemmatimonadaceae bacterium]